MKSLLMTLAQASALTFGVLLAFHDMHIGYGLIAFYVCMNRDYP